MRLILTTLAAALVVFLIILTARTWGQGQIYHEFNHAFFNTPAPLVIVKANSVASIEQARELKKDVVIWLDTRSSNDNVLFLLAPSEDQKFLLQKQKEQEAHPEVLALKGNKLAQYSWAEINAFHKDLPELKTIYQKFPDQKFVVNLVDNSVGINDAVVAALKGLNSENRTLIQSDTLVVMTSTKDLKPEWVYGTSQADLMRLLSFESMWIISTTQYKGDVFISPFAIIKRPAFNDGVIEEMKRRHKRIFLGPVTEKVQLDDAKRLSADGYITENLPQLLEWLDERPAQ